MTTPRRYELRCEPNAWRELKSLARGILQRVTHAIGALATNPRPPGCVKLAGTRNAYRIRVGDCRVVTEIRDRELVVLVRRVARLDQAYRGR